MEKDVILLGQPGCWLRSSHTFKECVIAHWSSEVAPKIHGAKRYTKLWDGSRQKVLDETKKAWKLNRDIAHKESNFNKHEIRQNKEPNGIRLFRYHDQFHNGERAYSSNTFCLDHR